MQLANNCMYVWIHSFIDLEMLAMLDPAVVFKVIIKVQKSLQKAHKIQTISSPVLVQSQYSPCLSNCLS